jgi:EpsI family protein
MIRRMLITTGLLLSGFGYVAHASKSETVAPRMPLETLPLQVGEWTGGPAAPFTPEVLKVLGVDDYVNRNYAAGTQPFVNLYVGFYQSQRQGDTIHSPLNCLPGAGWEPVSKDRVQFSATDAQGVVRQLRVNEFVIQKGLDRQLVLYWYQSHGRIIASEYTSKMYMVYDALRLNRTDAAMVRVITPIPDDAAAARGAASARARAFVQAIFPSLTRSLPS